METIIGFIAGYLAGSRDGKEGLARARSSWEAIKTSPEVRRLAGEAFSFAEVATRRASARSLSAVGGSVVRTLAERVPSPARRESPAA